MDSVDLPLSAADGRSLAGTAFEPAEARGALVVLSALGVPQPYYRRFAEWMAARGVAVLTFDYRGVSASRRGPLRRDPATLSEWGRLDIPAALDAARARWPGLPCWAIGHSYGGQGLGITERAQELDGAVVVAASAADLTLYPPHLRRRYALQMRTAPLVAAVLGYVPGAFGIGEDLPAGVVTEWARACLTPDYLRGVYGRENVHHHTLELPMRFYDFPDDVMAPPAAAAALRGWYERARVVHQTIAPADLGLEKIGHFGFFRPGPTERVWDEIRGAVLGEGGRAVG